MSENILTITTDPADITPMEITSTC